MALSTVFVPGLVLFALLLAAVFTDLSSRRIPNKIVLLGWAAGVFWHTFGPVGRWAFDPFFPGAVGAYSSVLAAMALLFLFIPFYVLRVMGAGDVKLMSVVGGVFGLSEGYWTHLLGVSLLVLLCGGLLSIVRLLLAGRLAPVMANLRLILVVFTGRLAGTPAPVFDPKVDSADRMPYAVAIALGTSLYVVGKWAGWITVL